MLCYQIAASTFYVLQCAGMKMKMKMIGLLSPLSSSLRRSTIMSTFILHIEDIGYDVVGNK